MCTFTVLHVHHHPVPALWALKEHSVPLVPSWGAAVSSCRPMSWIAVRSSEKKWRKQTKKIMLLCLAAGQEVTLSSRAFGFCSWKNSLDNKRHAGLLWTSLFLAHFYKKKKISIKNVIWEEKKLNLLALGAILCQAAFTARHDRPSELHEVIDEDRPRP